MITITRVYAQIHQSLSLTPASYLSLSLVEDLEIMISKIASWTRLMTPGLEQLW